VAAVAAVAQLAEQSLAVLQRVRLALDGMKNQHSYLKMVSEDLANVVHLVEAIKLQPELQQESLKDGIQVLLDRANLLETCVADIQKKVKNGNLLKKFVYQLDKGPVEQKKLADMMENLSQAKETLFGLIQVIHVGISSRGSNFVVNLNLVDKVNSEVKKVPGLENGLQMFHFLKERGFGNSENREVELTGDDAIKLAELGWGPVDDDDDAMANNIVGGNIAHRYAIQPNAAVGVGTEDRYAVRKVKNNIVFNNTAEDSAWQPNTPISLETRDATLAHQQEMARLRAMLEEAKKS
jgi:hypothetical protein